MRGRKPGGGKEWAEAAQLCRGGPHVPASLATRAEGGGTGAGDGWATTKALPGPTTEREAGPGGGAGGAGGAAGTEVAGERRRVVGTGPDPLEPAGGTHA